MTLKFCPNGECINFQCEVETGINRCPMCGWDMQLVKKQSESMKEDSDQNIRTA